MHGTTLHNIERLQKEFSSLSSGKEALLTLLEEAELPESVYNSNAIENSTLTLQETEKILIHQELPAHHNQREIFEAINLGKVTEYLAEKIRKGTALTEDLLLFIHKTLISHIRDDIAGRYRQDKEFVRVGLHIAPAPVHVSSLMATALKKYHGDAVHVIDRVVNFHLEFERIHPFVDGNGRVGRALMNFQLKSHGYPPLIVRNKEKQDYYRAFQAYDLGRSTKELEHVVALGLKESLHKRITYLRGDEIVFLSDIGKEQKKHSPQSILNSAKKQALPAFRERGKWKVGREMFGEWMKEPR